MAAPFVVDIMLVRLRSMRFTFETVSMAIAESDMVSSVAISNWRPTSQAQFSS
ncbi:hypothetical protein PC128_g15020 [Phytophthora cactorum]|nr:hypothetical protein PC120_g15213 [Phytophthora cactorum]KAG3056843.1 hypothetical protein PC121_g15145 [Phytophthora cactorum]KAG3181674.1 hypothetical protein PC128_g15020 [Phytophthora cactorum]KAG4055498.1 hypothetical protein PC123_g9418 [Phytophthora cactorum]